MRITFSSTFLLRLDHGFKTTAIEKGQATYSNSIGKVVTNIHKSNYAALRIVP